MIGTVVYYYKLLLYYYYFIIILFDKGYTVFDKQYEQRDLNS